MKAQPSAGDRNGRRVAVTGGSGKLGSAVVSRLSSESWDVTSLDAVAPREPMSPYSIVDLTNFGQTYEALSFLDSRVSGLDAVVHLAAIPGPGMAPNQALFENNFLSTVNVFYAAKHAGIRNIVWASSETVLGVPITEPPLYVPIDEAYPPSPSSAYALAKHLEEQMAAVFCRWDPDLKMIGLRFSNVMVESDYDSFELFQDDPRGRSWNLWSYIDARDGAQAVSKALDYDSKGLEIFIIASADTVMHRSAGECLDEVFPNVPRRGTLADHGTLLSIEKAGRLLGFSPEHTWRTT